MQYKCTNHNYVNHNHQRDQKFVGEKLENMYGKIVDHRCTYCTSKTTMQLSGYSNHGYNERNSQVQFIHYNIHLWQQATIAQFVATNAQSEVRIKCDVQCVTSAL